MSFLATNDRIYITDVVGNIKLDTNTRMPSIIQTVNGIHHLTEANPQDPGSNRQFSKVIGYTDPSANFIYPTYRYTTSLPGLFSSTEYVSGLGTSIHTLGYSQNFGGTFEFSSFTFLLNNGVLSISTEGGFRDGTAIQFKIYVGKI